MFVSVRESIKIIILATKIVFKTLTSQCLVFLLNNKIYLDSLKIEFGIGVSNNQSSVSSKINLGI